MREPSMRTVGERISGLEATVTAFQRYESEHWHKLANDLQRVMALPESIARDLGKLQSLLEKQINASSKEIEQSLSATISEALQPIKEDVEQLKAEVEVLKTKSNVFTGAKLILIFVVQTIIALIAAAAGWFSMRQ